MKQIFKKLIDEHIVEITEAEYVDLVETDKIFFGGSLSMVTNNGQTFCYIPFKDVRQTQCPPLKLSLPPMSDDEKEDFIRKFKKAMITNQHFL